MWIEIRKNWGAIFFEISEIWVKIFKIHEQFFLKIELWNAVSLDCLNFLQKDSGFMEDFARIGIMLKNITVLNWQTTGKKLFFCFCKFVTLRFCGVLFHMFSHKTVLVTFRIFIQFFSVDLQEKEEDSKDEEDDNEEEDIDEEDEENEDGDDGESSTTKRRKRRNNANIQVGYKKKIRRN